MEESVIISNAFHHVAWGTPITVYFWLVGVSAGSFLISSLGWVFGVERYKPLALVAALLAIVTLLFVPVLLIWDIGQPWRFFYLMLPAFWHNTAPMAWGSLLIMSYMLFMLIYVFFLIKENSFWTKFIGAVAIVMALSLEWYTGVVMEFNPGRYINHTALAPLLFLTGAFISGTAMLIIVVWVKNMFAPPGKQIEWKLIEELAKYMMYGVIFDLFLLWLEFVHTLYGSESVFLGHEIVLMELFRFPYLWLEVILGLIVPLFILLSPLKRFSLGIVSASLLIAVGVYGMRIWWVMGGQYMQSFY